MRPGFHNDVKQGISQDEKLVNDKNGHNCIEETP